MTAVQGLSISLSLLLVYLSPHSEWATPETTPAIDQYALHLKRFYGDYKLPKEDWPPRVSDRYVNLALINHEKIPQSYEIDDFLKSTLHGTVDDLYFEKQTIALEQLFQPKQLLEHGSLQLRNKLLQGSINRQFESILQGLPSPRERVQQTDKLLQNLQGSLPLGHAILASLLQSVTQPSVCSSSNVKGLKVLCNQIPL